MSSPETITLSRDDVARLVRAATLTAVRMCGRSGNPHLLYNDTLWRALTALGDIKARDRLGLKPPQGEPSA